jgi:hypothetical protein
MLQRDGGHSHESVRMSGAPLGDFFILQLDEVASQRAIRRVRPGVDVDYLIVDTLRVHIDQSLRVAEGDVARKVPLRGCCQIGVLDQVPDFRNEAVRMNVDGLHATTGNEQLTTLTWRGADLERRKTAIRKAAADEYSGHRARRILEEVSAIRHGVLLGI